LKKLRCNKNYYDFHLKGATKLCTQKKKSIQQEDRSTFENIY